MADIELVIKIPEEIRSALIYNIQLSQDQKSISDSYISRAIINGTPLQKTETAIWLHNEGMYVCSSCLKQYPFMFYGTNYCPNCGVKMEAEDGNNKQG